MAIQANHLSFQLYKGGVYSGECGTKLDHGVLAVGYGELNSKKYFRVKNSWGAGWGLKGYILIERNGDGKGKCGIQMDASFPKAWSFIRDNLWIFYWIKMDFKNRPYIIKKAVQYQSLICLTYSFYIQVIIITNSIMKDNVPRFVP